jgi:outer membrane protein assembly factor BamB
VTVRTAGVCTALLACLATPWLDVRADERAQTEEWPQWGGPRRDFTTSTRLPQTWPEGGPRVAWERPLGDGFSSIAASRGALYTMARRDGREVVVSLRADTGATRWEYGYDAPFSREYSMEHGEGPHATPLVAGRRVFTVGSTGRLHALDAETGVLLWAHDLVGELGGFIRVNGYAASPLAWKQRVIVPVGGESGALVAFDQETGRRVWQSDRDRISPASPILIDLDGETELVAFLYDRVVGLDPDSGRLLWSHPHVTDFGLNVTTPIWTAGQVLLISSAYNGGTRALRLERTGNAVSVRELWFSNRLRLHFSTALLVEGLLCGSSGDLGPAPFTAIDVSTGALAWRQRSIGRVSGVRAPNGLLLLEEDGDLLLADVTREGLTVRSRATVATGTSWTTPAIVGTRIYLRDRQTIRALELSDQRLPPGRTTVGWR